MCRGNCLPRLINYNRPMRLNQEKKLKSRPRNRIWNLESGIWNRFRKEKFELSRRVIFGFRNLFSQRADFIFPTSKQFWQKTLILILVFAWIFSGWPPIWQNPRVPPNIQVAQAATETFTTAGTFTNGWTAPADVYSVTAETWGGGGGSGGGTSVSLPGGSGGGGGAYALKVISVTPGNSYTYVVGAAGLKNGGTAGGSSSFTGNASVQSLACGGTSG